MTLKKTGIIIVAAGAVLILSALLLFLHNRQEDVQAGQEAESLLASVEAAISANTTDSSSATLPDEPVDAQSTQNNESLPEYDEEDISFDTTDAASEIAPNESESISEQSQTPVEPEMPVVMIDGFGYIGYIEIPTLGVKLPVMSEWDYYRLNLAPCRQFGSSRTDDLVIAAHNYRSHFGNLKNLSTGDTVTFTDMEGIANTYSVEKIETLNPDEVEAVQNSGYALVLYTCNKSGNMRVTVFCSRVDSVE